MEALSVEYFNLCISFSNKIEVRCVLQSTLICIYVGKWLRAVMDNQLPAM